jgi:S1-C subfamily serine protease
MLRRVALAAAVVVTLGAGYGGTARAATTPTKGVVIVNTNLALQNASAAGTGIVLTTTGEVLTNNHVIAGATTVKVTVPATRRTYVATVVGYDITDDVALLQLQGATGLATATAESSAKLRIGQLTRAVGNANGGGNLVVTSGKVIGLNQTISVRGDDGTISQLGHLVETSAHLVPGDSGGPLLDAAGRVIGMDAAGSPSFSFNGNAPGYAISINHALTIVKLIAGGNASALVHIGPTAFVGLQLADTPDGIAVQDVVPGSPAEAAGLARGDLITSADGTSLSSTTDLRTVIFAHHPGDSVAIGYTDALGNEATVTIALASGPPQ